MEQVMLRLELFYKRLKRRINRRWMLRMLALTPFAAIAFVLILIAVYRFANPTITSLIAANAFKGTAIHQKWVPLDKMSPHLPRAVIMSEDARFCQHWGVDWNAVEQAWAEAEGWNVARGVSTIPMQVSKNLFLWPWRSYLRKIFEVPLAYLTSLAWSKERMIEIYLNVAEWGPGIFGAEAASRYHFKKSVSKLSRREAALLAASLPNPYIRRAGKPGPKTRRVAAIILRRLRGADAWTNCLSAK